VFALIAMELVGHPEQRALDHGAVDTAREQIQDNRHV